MEENKKIKWHPGFYAGIDYELRQYRKWLSYEPEHELSKEPLRMDLLIIKKDDGAIVDNQIGAIFKKYNIVEYKSPDDNLTIDDFYKTIGYACLYKGLGEKVDYVKTKDLSISFFSHKRPKKLFSTAEGLGAVIEQKYDGVYYISGVINIPIQIVVIKELQRTMYAALKVMTKNASEEDIRSFVKETTCVADKADQMNIDAVLHVSVSANFELYEKIRRDTAMCEALRELMKDEINKEVAEAEEHGIEKGIACGIERGIDATIRNMLDSGDFTDRQICIATGKSIEYIQKLKKKYQKNH